MKFKKVLATTMAATMVMASAMTVCAAGPYPNLKLAKENVLVAGDANQTQVAGDYSAECVRGAAVLTAFEDVKAALGLTANQRPTVVIYDAEMKSSPDAIATLEAATKDAGATEVASIYFELGAKENGKWLSKVNDATVTVKVGLPKNADKTKKYSVIYVQENGTTTILEDLDTSDKTVTFKASTGVGTYGIVTDVAVVPTVVVPEVPAEEAPAASAEEAPAEEAAAPAEEASEVPAEEAPAVDANGAALTEG